MFQRKFRLSCAALAACVLTPLAAFAADEVTLTPSAATMTDLWGVMVGEDGAEWRSPNPDFDGSESQPSAFAIRWRWDTHGQYAIGELLGVYDRADGERTAKYWDLYTIHNPATGETTASQIGWNGAVGSGPMYRKADGRIMIDQVLSGPNGSMKPIRHEEIMAADRKSYKSNVYERNESGAWELKREWTWTKVE